MTGSTIVLDASVLIGAYEAQWFDALSFWTDEYELCTPQSVWNNEFTPGYEIKDAPPWLAVRKVTDQLTVSNPGQLSQEDWRGIILAETTDGGLITSDKRLKQQAESRNVKTRWSAGFLMQTFEECGITRSVWNSSLESYIEDSFVTDEVATVLRNAEKTMEN